MTKLLRLIIFSCLTNICMLKINMNFYRLFLIALGLNTDLSFNNFLLFLDIGLAGILTFTVKALQFFLTTERALIAALLCKITFGRTILLQLMITCLLINTVLLCIFVYLLGTTGLDI